LPLAVADYAPVALWHWAVLGLSAMGVAAGITCVSMAFRKADAGLVSPMMYSEMIWALV
ncbi:MAG TPA: EamA family transporter, partial [Rhodospirillaceae bacterium]|nr:EamA family transporter [Rhodospirillaceae bacterium]